jgi:hypothetical protein
MGLLIGPSVKDGLGGNKVLLKSSPWVAASPVGWPPEGLSGTLDGAGDTTCESFLD